MRSKGRILVFVFAGGVGAAIIAPALGAAAVSCGDTVTTSVTLPNDLVCGDAIALTVGASGITIDLNGHTLDGSGTGGTGVDVTGHDGVTVKNGTITQYTIGIHVDGGSAKTKILGVTAASCTDGIVVDMAAGTTITGADVRAALHTGIIVNSGATKTKVDGSGIVDTGFSGIYAAGTGIQLIKNVVGASGLVNNGAGIELDGANGATVSGNAIGRAQGAGINVINGSTGIVATKNVARGNGGPGLHVEGAGAVVISGNTLAGNGDAGIYLQTATGPVTIAKNVSGGNEGRGLISLAPAIVTSNLLSDNRNDGLFATTGTTVAKNLAIGNSGFGILNFGVDGGGNKARFNAQGVQCSGVVCARH